MNCLYTIGNWSVYSADGGDGSVKFLIGDSRTPAYTPYFAGRGYIRSSWGRPGIRAAMTKVIKKVDKNHQLDLETQAGMDMAKSVAENYLSDDQIENLLESVLT